MESPPALNRRTAVFFGSQSFRTIAIVFAGKSRRYLNPSSGF
jgi:hypothetical protein